MGVSGKEQNRSWNRNSRVLKCAPGAKDTGESPETSASGVTGLGGRIDNQMYSRRGGASIEMTSTTNLSKPTLDSAPDTCHYQGCDKSPSMTVRFRDPNEYLCYCRDHADKVFTQQAYAKYRSQLK
jgi:hypothetical protein